MNETTNLNSELLSADARGRKHIPFAVFAVILIHVILFLVLLIAAGCRAKARAKMKAAPAAEMLAAQSAAAPLTQARTNTTPLPASGSTPSGSLQPVVATESPLEADTVRATLRKTSQKAAPAQTRPTASAFHAARVYTVKAGDTVEKIARMHRTSVRAIRSENNLKNDLLHPGQQLRVSSQKRKSTDEV